MSNASDFVIENGILKKYVGPGGDVVIPEGVTEIGKEVFNKNKAISSITLPKSLRIVGSQAFASCDALMSVSVPSAVKEIRWGAFDWCKNLKSVSIDNLEAWCSIEFDGMFANSGNPLSAGANLYLNGELLKNLVVPETVKEIHDYAFSHCASLESVVIPEGVTTIGEYAFFECSNLKTVSLPAGVETIKRAAFLHCKKLAAVNIPDSTKIIGELAFKDCRKLLEIKLPEGVETLGDEAFGNCGKLKVTLPGTLKKPKTNMIGFTWKTTPFAGNSCSIQVEKWSSIISKMMEGCTVEEIITSNYALVPGEILFPAAVSMVKKKGWDSDSDIGKALLAALAKNAGKICLDALKNPEWLQLLCDNGLIKAKDLDSYLEEAEKQKNTEAKAILLNYQNSLGNKPVEKARAKKEKEAAAYEDALVERAATRDPAKGIEGMTFVITGKLKAWPKVWSSKEEVQEYLTRYGAVLGASVSKQTDYLVTNDADSGSAKNEKARRLGVEVIEEEAFNQLVGRRFIDEERICVPEWVTSIEPAAFSFPDWASWKSHAGYKKLREVVVPAAVTSIGDRAFAGAENLESIVLPDDISGIGDWAFAGCSMLHQIILPDKLTSIGARAFDKCESLIKIVLPAGVESLGLGAFGNCKNLEEIHISGVISAIEMLAFEGCPKLTIYAPAGSNAEQYAKENNIPFVAE